MKKIYLNPAVCAADLSDGSERGPYVNQDYILQKMGRPHRAVNLMYCYYPFDKEWPARISEVTEKPAGGGAWSYAYDDYFPLTGETPYEQMRDVRRHGQDVIFTLTCDPHATDEQITRIAERFIPFGRTMLRLNHEATGSWFSFNKRASYQQIADFFIHFREVFQMTAPQVKLILCIGGIESLNHTEMEKEKEFTRAVQLTDIWSVDKYPSLNYGWPGEVAEKDNHGHYCWQLENVWEMEKRSFERFSYLSGGIKKPMQLCEHNEDGDVTGPARQAVRLKQFYDMAEKEGEGWLSGITMYQFRDDGRLGLEMTDPGNKEVGIEQPILKVYRDIIHRDFFSPKITTAQELPGEGAPMRWGGSEDAEGVGMELCFEKAPEFAEAYFEGELKDMNLLMELNGRWFYKKPGVSFVDFMPAFWEKPIEGGTLQLNLFAPPPTGENVDDGHEDWRINYRTVLPALPRIRIRYDAPMDV